MPEKHTIKRAKKAKSASAKAGEFVREEFHHVREGKHGASSAKQVVAIGLSKAREAGVKVPRKTASKSPSKSQGKTAAAHSPAERFFRRNEADSA
jgi:hypothetical protein